jgi:hypothetical protein
VFKIAVAPQARTQRLAPKGARTPLIACGAFGFCFPASQKSFYGNEGLRKTCPGRCIFYNKPQLTVRTELKVEVMKMGDKIRIEGETWRDNRSFDAGDLLVAAVTGGLWLIAKELTPHYTVTVHTDHGDFSGHGESIDEARENAYDELRKHL